jgi:hypothetical protein
MKINKASLDGKEFMYFYSQKRFEGIAAIRLLIEYSSKIKVLYLKNTIIDNSDYSICKIIDNKDYSQLIVNSKTIIVKDKREGKLK